MEPVAPTGPPNPPDSSGLSSQRTRKGRRKKSKEQPAASTEGCGRRLRSSSRAKCRVTGEVPSQAEPLPPKEPQRAAGPTCGRGKPRAWARAWAAALEKPNSESPGSPAGESPRDLCPSLLDTIPDSSVPAHLSVGDSAQANPIPLASVEAGPTEGDVVLADADSASSDPASADSEPVDSLSPDPVLTDSAAVDPPVVVPVSDDVPPAIPVPSDQPPVDPVPVKSRPTDPRRGAVLSAQATLPSQFFQESEASDLSKAVPEGKAVGPPKVKSGTSATTQEARPRPLSLSEYRRRRQQRQAEAEERSWQRPAGKWPSLPETPTGLADIPCLVIPTAPAKKTAVQKSPEAPPEPCSILVAPSPASPSPEPPASKPPASVTPEQVPSQEMPLPATPVLPAVQSMPPPMPTALPFPPGGLGIAPMLPLSASGQGVPSLPPPPLQTPSLPVSVGPVPPDPYTHYAPVPPWPCYPSVSPSGYPCLPPPPPVPLVSGTQGTLQVGGTA